MTEIVGEWLEGCLRKEQGHELWWWGFGQGGKNIVLNKIKNYIIARALTLIKIKKEFSLVK